MQLSMLDGLRLPSRRRVLSPDAFASLAVAGREHATERRSPLPTDLLAYAAGFGVPAMVHRGGGGWFWRGGALVPVRIRRWIRQLSRPIVGKLRALCLAYPETSETSSWGHPNFRAGKRTFATFEVVKGRASIAFRVDAVDADLLLRKRQFFSDAVWTRTLGERLGGRSDRLASRSGSARSQLSNCCD